LMFKNDTILLIGEQHRLIIRLLWTSAYIPGEIYRMFCEVMAILEYSHSNDMLLNSPAFANLLHLPEVQLLTVIMHSGLLECFDRMKVLAQGNAFFWIEEGYIGTAPHAVVVGDMVAFIPGIAAPMILRPTKASRYQVIGHAYVPSMMAGEMWIKREDEGREREDEDNNFCDIFLV